MTDEEWKEFQRIETMSLAELVQKFGHLSFPGDLPDSPDSKTPKRRTVRGMIGAMIAGLIEGAAQSHKDKPTDKK